MDQRKNQAPELLFVLVLSVALDAMIYLARGKMGVEGWHVVMPSVLFFAAAFALSVACPRQWLAVGLAPAALCVIVVGGSRILYGTHNQPEFAIMLFLAHTLTSLTGAAIGMGVRRLFDWLR